jgi:small conductance mechanosensitive channel
MFLAFISQETMDAWVQKIIIAAAILLLGAIAVLFIVGLAKKFLKRTPIEKTILSFVANLLRAVLFVLLIVIALHVLGVPQASMVAAIGAAGLAIALSLQGSLANLAAGVLISIFRPFKIGDAVEVGGQVGVVDELQILFTRLHTFDNRGLIVPNAQVLGSHIINMSAHDTRRVDFTFGIGYNDDIDKAKRILTEILDQDPRILKEPVPVIGLSELGDSSVNFWVRPWVNSPDYLGVLLDIPEQVKKRFDAEGISIPFPQRDVHLYYENQYPQ